MMTNTSVLLGRNIDQIMVIWERRTLEEIRASNLQETLALRDSMPEYLQQLTDALSKTIERSEARRIYDKSESTRVGKKHGKERATSGNYTMDQMILEYHILRQVIFDVIEQQEIAITPVEREVIVCSIEQAVNDAATQFTDTLKELQGHLTQTLAHDLRNTISTTRISAQLMLKKPDNVKACIEGSSRIIRSMDRVEKMINDLLDASKLKADVSHPLEFKECDLEWIARDVAFELNIGGEDRVIVRSTGKCIGYWNEDGLRRMIENLVNNAFKYGYQKTPVTISILNEDNSATFIVHNEGEPIASNEKATLFEKFTRSKSAENKIGWGLGLSIVKSIVDAHTGTIILESEKGIGTTFIIKLPKNPPTKLGM